MACKIALFSYSLQAKGKGSKNRSFLVCAGHGMSSVGDKPTTGSYRQV